MSNFSLNQKEFSYAWFKLLLLKFKWIFFAIYTNSEGFIANLGLPYSSDGKESTFSAGDPGSIPG